MTKPLSGLRESVAKVPAQIERPILKMDTENVLAAEACDV